MIFLQNNTCHMKHTMDMSQSHLNSNISSTIVFNLLIIFIIHYIWSRTYANVEIFLKVWIYLNFCLKIIVWSLCGVYVYDHVLIFIWIALERVHITAAKVLASPFCWRPAWNCNISINEKDVLLRVLMACPVGNQTQSLMSGYGLFEVV